MAQGKTSPGYLVPRGLSRISAAAYVGVSVTFFDQLVDDGRMPQPKRVNTRKLWDRWAIDAAFDALPDEVDSRSADPEQVFAEWLAGNDPKEDETRKFYMDSLGYDPRGMSASELAAAETQRADRWTERVRGEPLNRREQMALAGLYERRGRLVGYGEIKGAGYITEERLSARGYVTVSRDGDRFLGWQITDAGEAAYLAFSQTGNRREKRT